MSSPSSDARPPAPPAIAEEAAAWLARRDRGLSAAEQDEFLQWLAADPRHSEMLTRQMAAFERMMRLYEWQPGQSAEPNPDLFAPRRRWPRSLVVASLAAAAAVLIGTTVWWHTPTTSPTTAVQRSYLRVNERHALPDGSIVELKDGSRITVGYTSRARRVQLEGEGLFTVARDPSRPFIVDAGGVAVRAVGTIFNVRVDSDAVEVIVTEGRVQLAKPDLDPASIPVVTAQQRALVPRLVNAPPQIMGVSAPQMAQALAWQAPRLQFFETPLGVAAAEFNRHTRTQLVIPDEKLRLVPSGGTFRVDNVDGFVRLLEATLDIRAEPRGSNDIGLTRAR